MCHEQCALNHDATESAPIVSGVTKEWLMYVLMNSVTVICVLMRLNVLYCGLVSGSPNIVLTSAYKACQFLTVTKLSTLVSCYGPQ